jgi:hypothetical protein
MLPDTSDIRLSPEQQAYVATQAEQLGVPWNAVLDALVPASLSAASAPRTVYEAFAQSGYLGAACGLPADLSTNPVHLEGFGR